MAHFPAAGEIVIFDRSWYNRAGVERVMGFCTKEEHHRFLELCPTFEKHLVGGGLQLIKYWLEVSNDEQKRRFEARVEDPLRQWKLSNMDLPSRQVVRVLLRAMLEPRTRGRGTSSSDDKRRARLNCIARVWYRTRKQRQTLRFKRRKGCVCVGTHRQPAVHRTSL
jgi:polyphosphate kinase 2 (PPK2 family)